MYNVLDIAQYIVEYSHNTGNAESMSNLKLQKVLYYIQAAFLVERKKKCFDSPILAWALGPVVPDAYNKYKIFGRRSIPKQKKRESMIFDSKNLKIIFKESGTISIVDKKIIEKVVDAYAKIIDPFYLVRKTHEEDPWILTQQNEEIKIDLIREYYTKYPKKIYE